MAESGSISGVRERHLRRLFSLAFILLLFILLRRLDQEAIANFGLDQGLDQLFHPIRKKKIFLYLLKVPYTSGAATHVNGFDVYLEFL